MKLECTFCKSKDPEMIPFRWAQGRGVESLVFCSAKCLVKHRCMTQMLEHTGLKACIYHKIMVFSRCIHRLNKWLFRNFKR